MVMTLFLFIVLALAVSGVEIVVVLGLVTVGITWLTGAFTLDNIGITAFDALNSAPLVAMPLYVLAGNIILRSGIADQLVEFARNIVGGLPGGLAVSSIFASGFFAAISGSNSATTATIGQIMLPRMRAEGYPDHFTLSTVASGGTVGIIIPPSIVFILYGVAAGASIGDLFLAGIIPGILMVLSMAAVALTTCARRGWGNRHAFTIRGMIRSAWEVKWAAFAVILILGGIYGGIFTPTEAAGVAVTYCLIVGFFITRRLKLRDLPSVIVESARVSGIIAPILVMSVTLSQVFVMVGISDQLVAGLTSVTQSPTAILLIMMSIVLAIGLFLEATPAMLILTPLFAPLVAQIGMSPVHFGVVMVMGLSIGFITPPMGLNLFVASAIGKTSIHRIARHATPYALMLVLVWLVVALVPWLSLVFL